jgi:hypothetical protein
LTEIAVSRPANEPISTANTGQEPVNIDTDEVSGWHQSLLQLFDLVSFRSRHLNVDAF